MVELFIMKTVIIPLENEYVIHSKYFLKDQAWSGILGQIPNWKGYCEAEEKFHCPGYYQNRL